MAPKGRPGARNGAGRGGGRGGAARGPSRGYNVGGGARVLGAVEARSQTATTETSARPVGGEVVALELRLLSGAHVGLGGLVNAGDVSELRRWAASALNVEIAMLRLVSPAGACLKDTDPLASLCPSGSVVHVCVLPDPREVKLEARIASLAGKENFDKLGQCSSLDLSGHGLTTLPRRMAAILTGLQKLVLTGNNFAQLPVQLCQLPSLRVLDVHSNRLLALPEDFTGPAAATLESLDFGKNHLMHLPRVFAQLKVLTKLGLESNQLARLPDELGKHSTLEELQLDFNRLTEQALEGLGGLTSLRALSLGGNRLAGLPQCVGQFLALEALELSGNPLIALHECVANLHALRSLKLNNTCLSLLPPSFGGIGLHGLQRLELNRGHLSSLPVDFGGLVALEDLELNGNRLAELPSSFSNLAMLRRCILSANRLTCLPEDFGRLAALEELELNENSLEWLPESFSSLSMLRRLEIKGNALNALPKRLCELPSLQRVEVRGNPLASPGVQAALSEHGWLPRERRAELPLQPSDVAHGS